ncbi:MAG: protein phosphatase 2C domain-containing protein [Magnetococcales bacterium]|nr:protein phosphatase 2C domain-containing protein [Magnetococcales bacterium]
MTIPSKKKFTPEQRDSIEKLVHGLFVANIPPFFDRSELSYFFLDEFIKSDEVVDKTFEFILHLSEIWMEKYPKQPRLKQLKSVAINPKVSISPDSTLGDVTNLATEENAMGNKVLSTRAPAVQDSPQVSNSPIPVLGNDEVLDTKWVDNVKKTQNITPHAQTPTQRSLQDRPVLSSSSELSSRPGWVPPAGIPPGKPVDPTASFSASNAMVGQTYIGKIENVGTAPRSIQLRNVRLPANLGLSFDAESGDLLGTPLVAGDHEITFQWSENGSMWFSGKCVLIVNPEPRSLWKINEPPANSLYKKPHTDGQLIVVPGFKIVSASRRGRSHEHAGTFRDDDFFVSHDASSGWSVVIVADGAGSAKFSRRGSELAVKAAGDYLVSNLAGGVGAELGVALGTWNIDPAGAGKLLGDKFYHMFHMAGTMAIQKIEAESKLDGVSVKEYSTTLLAAAVKRHDMETFLATFWMGDGAIAAYGPRGKVRLMGTPDSGEFAGQTRFLDRSALSDHQGFAKRIRIGRFSDLSTVMLMTDGISDPKFETDNGLADGAKWDALWDEIEPCLATSAPDKSLIDWLDFFIPGHHDDRTIALLW